MTSEELTKAMKIYESKDEAGRTQLYREVCESVNHTRETIAVSPTRIATSQSVKELDELRNSIFTKGKADGS